MLTMVIRTFTLNPNHYDEIKGANVFTEEAPQAGWYLKGFYGEQTRFYLARVGPIWGH